MASQLSFRRFMGSGYWGIHFSVTRSRASNAFFSSAAWQIVFRSMAKAFLSLSGTYFKVSLTWWTMQRWYSVFCCCKWLDSFRGWEDFIDRNFLQDFIGADDQPVPLCKGHSWEAPQVQNFDGFFKNAWQIIEKRSLRMIEVLEKKASRSI